MLDDENLDKYWQHLKTPLFLSGGRYYNTNKVSFPSPADIRRLLLPIFKAQTPDTPIKKQTRVNKAIGRINALKDRLGLKIDSREERERSFTKIKALKKELTKNQPETPDEEHLLEDCVFLMEAEANEPPVFFIAARHMVNYPDTKVQYLEGPYKYLITNDKVKNDWLIVKYLKKEEKMIIFLAINLEEGALALPVHLTKGKRWTCYGQLVRFFDSINEMAHSDAANGSAWEKIIKQFTDTKKQTKTWQYFKFRATPPPYPFVYKRLQEITAHSVPQFTQWLSAPARLPSVEDVINRMISMSDLIEALRHKVPVPGEYYVEEESYNRWISAISDASTNVNRLIEGIDIRKADTTNKPTLTPADVAQFIDIVQTIQDLATFYAEFNEVSIPFLLSDSSNDKIMYTPKDITLKECTDVWDLIYSISITDWSKNNELLASLVMQHDLPMKIFWDLNFLSYIHAVYCRHTWICYRILGASTGEAIDLRRPLHELLLAVPGFLNRIPERNTQNKLTDACQGAKALSLEGKMVQSKFGTTERAAFAHLRNLTKRYLDWFTGLTGQGEGPADFLLDSPTLRMDATGQLWVEMPWRIATLTAATQYPHTESLGCDLGLREPVAVYRDRMRVAGASLEHDYESINLDEDNTQFFQDLDLGIARQRIQEKKEVRSICDNLCSALIRTSSRQAQGRRNVTLAHNMTAVFVNNAEEETDEELVKRIWDRFEISPPFMHPIEYSSLHDRPIPGPQLYTRLVIEDLSRYQARRAESYALQKASWLRGKFRQYCTDAKMRGFNLFVQDPAYTSQIASPLIGKGVPVGQKGVAFLLSRDRPREMRGYPPLREPTRTTGLADEIEEPSFFYRGDTWESGMKIPKRVFERIKKVLEDTMPTPEEGEPPGYRFIASGWGNQLCYMTEDGASLFGRDPNAARNLASVHPLLWATARCYLHAERIVQGYRPLYSRQRLRSALEFALRGLLNWSGYNPNRSSLYRSGRGYFCNFKTLPERSREWIIQGLNIAYQVLVSERDADLKHLRHVLESSFVGPVKQKDLKKGVKAFRKAFPEASRGEIEQLGLSFEWWQEGQSD